MNISLALENRVLPYLRVKAKTKRENLEIIC